MKLPGGKKWTPLNYDHSVSGPIPMVRALAQSLNLATIHLGMAVGLDTIAKEFTKLGLEQQPQAVPAMLLGGVSVTPIEVAQIYNSLANGGFRTPLRAVRAVVDEHGKELKAFPLEVTQVADASAVYQLTRMMVEVMRRGTGQAGQAKLGGLVVAGKSGTTSDYRDGWFAGFSGSHVAVVWLGYDDNEPTRFTGASGALPIWAQIMGGIDTTSWDQPIPEGLSETKIEFTTGLGVDDTCIQNGLTVVVPNGTEIAMREGCTAANSGIADRAGAWLRGIIGR
jgi:penicillin-binding protein 1B